MKKLIAITSALVLFAASSGLFAQEAEPAPKKASISFGGWGRVGWAPLVFTGGWDDSKNESENYVGVGSGPGWNGIGGAVGFEVHGKNAPETIGFDAKLRYDPTSAVGWFANDNTADVWVKPFGDILTIRGGMFQEDSLRGKVGGLQEAFVVGGQTGDEDTIFKRFESGVMGAHFKLQPISALQIHALIGSNGTYGNGAAYADGAADTFAAGQYGFGYTIDSIGFVRFQFQGGKYGKGYWGKDDDGKDVLKGNSFISSTNDWNQIQLAFQLTAVENLNLDFGFTLPLEIKVVEKDDKVVGYSDLTTKDSTYQAPMVIALGANYTAGDLGVLVRFDTKLSEKKVVKDGAETTRGLVGLAFSVQPSYKLGDLGSILGDISIGIAGNSETKTGGTTMDNKDGATKLGLGVAFDKSLGGGGNFKIGVAAQIPVAGDKYENPTGSKAGDEAKSKDFKIAIPMVFTYSIYP
jgi:hypothetical protein